MRWVGISNASAEQLEEALDDRRGRERAEPARARLHRRRSTQRRGRGVRGARDRLPALVAARRHRQRRRQRRRRARSRRPPNATAPRRSRSRSRGCWRSARSSSRSPARRGPRRSPTRPGRPSSSSPPTSCTPSPRRSASPDGGRKPGCARSRSGRRGSTIGPMPRSMWSGAISFGLVNVPVKLYSAVSRKTVRFHQLNGKTGTPDRAEARGLRAPARRSPTRTSSRATS